MFRASLRRVTAPLAPLARAQPKRGMAGWNYGKEYKTAYMFGEKPGTPWEGWEPIVYFFYPLCFLTLAIGLNLKPKTGIRYWAYEEATIRLKLKEEGEEIKYGTHYQNRELVFTKEDEFAHSKLETEIYDITRK